MNMHSRKMIAPAIIVLILISYYLIVILTMLKMNLPPFLTIGIIAFSIVVSLVLIWVLIDRIKEIKGGEEDDLSKY